MKREFAQRSKRILLRELDESGFVGTILMNLSKAYDCILHELKIAKFEPYGLHKNSLNLIADYLGRKAKDENRLCIQ